MGSVLAVCSSAVKNWKNPLHRLRLVCLHSSEASLVARFSRRLGEASLSDIALLTRRIAEASL